MKKRVISGIVYAMILLGVFLTKVYAPQPWGCLAFDALIYFFSIVGTQEMLRAMSSSITKAEKGFVTIFSAICVPACVTFEMLWGYGVYAVATCFLLLAVALVCLLVLKNEETKVENIGVAIVSAIYPTLLLCVLALTNHFGEPVLLVENSVAVEGSMLSNSLLAMLFIFIVSPASDVAAFFTGMSLRKKFPKKFAPTISPNKTVVGFVGGVVGGALAGVAIYFIYNAICGDFSRIYIELPIYLLIGLVVSVASAFGDLIESAIKRERGIKDMGNIMPGHGGVLDRIDGTMLATVVVYLAFLIVRLLAV